MKRISTILLFLLLATTLKAQNLVPTDPYKRNVIIEEYTGVYCGYCPDGHKIANVLAAEYQDRLFVLNIHAGGYANDASIDFRTEDGNIIFSGAKANSFPSGNVNRVAPKAVGRDSWSLYVEQQVEQVAECNVAGQVVIDKDARKAFVTVEVYYTVNSISETNYLNVVMLQDNIIAYQNGDYLNPDQVVGNQYRHMHAFRDAITPAWGEEIAPTTAGTFITKTYEYDIPAKIGSFDVNIDDLEFVAFVTETKNADESTSPVLNANKLHYISVSDEDIHPTMLSVGASSAFSCSETQAIDVVVNNSGLAELTSLKFEVIIDDAEPIVKTWEGNAVSGQSFKVGFDVNLTEGTHEVEVKIVEANGEKYEEGKSLSVNKEGWVEYKTESAETEMTIEVIQDKYGSQITWELLGSDYSVLASGGPYENLKGQAAIELHRASVKVPMGECVKFIIKDSKSNGICCQYGDGFYRILNSKGKVIVKGDGDFGAESSCIVSIVEGEEEEPEILPAPTNVVAMTLNDTGLVLMWDAVEGAEKYNVYNQDKLVGSFEEINTQIEGLTPGTEYCFTVTAYDKNGESEKSEEACAKTSGEKPENIGELHTSVQFYPNPVNDKLFIKAEITVEQVLVYDIYGRRQVAVTPNHQNGFTVDVADLNSGIYFVKVLTENGEIVKRFVKN